MPRMNCPIPMMIALAALLFPAAAAAQPVIAVAPHQCVWRAGDNPTWAAADADEGLWQPFAASDAVEAQPRFWIRCRLDAHSYDGLAHPALQVRRLAAWEVFLDGVELGRNGNLESGEFGVNAIQILPLPAPVAGRPPAVVALRVTQRYTSLLGAFYSPAPEIRLGDQLALQNDRAGFLLGILPTALSNTLPFIAIGLIGLVLLAFSLPDGSHPEAVLFGISCVAVGLVFTGLLCGAMMLDEPAALFRGFFGVGFAASFITQYLFPFSVVRRRPPLIFWLPMSCWVVSMAWQLTETLAPQTLAFWMDRTQVLYLAPATYCAAALVVTAPLRAFFPWRRVPAHMRTIAATATAFAFTQTLFFSVVFVSYFLPSVLKDWMLPASSLTQLVAIAAIIALMLRDQRQTTLQRAALAGEMQAAGEIQRMLAPAAIDTAPGLKIDVAFHPMREIGGDFYLCRVLFDGRQRVLLGDVSGKGAAAAMAATLILGAASARESDSPSNLLAHLNRVLRENHLGGFATCLCADIAPDQSASIANAGHLPPYRNGEELNINAGLPLGVAAQAEYLEAHFQLTPGDSLTLLSDGVVEARGKSGELFGFDRTQSISTLPAEQIARAASTFGQEDDITVLTLTLAPAGAIHA